MRIDLNELRRKDPAKFYINWRTLDPKGYALTRIKVSCEDTREMMKKVSRGKASPKDATIMKREHFALIKRLSESCGLTKADVRAYYVK